jgi:hypothetical protein
LDVGFLLQNLNHILPSGEQQAAEAMADHFIGYINGEGWVKDAGAVGGEDVDAKVVVFTNKGVQHVGEKEYDRLYRDGRGEALKGIGGEKLWRLAEGWQGVRPDMEEDSNPSLSKEDDGGKSRL